MTSARTRSLAAVLLVATAAALPFLRGFLSGGVLFFRDLSRHFFPLRLYALDGLRAGELRYWNPLNHEGTPLPFPPLGYPLDALQLLWPSERGLSVLLALHVPLAAVAFLALARGLGARWPGACAGALVYALGGFALSTVNLYVYLQALAWCPLAVLTLHRAHSSARALALAAVVAGVTLSTAGVELVAQAFLLGLVLAVREGRRAARSVFAALLVGGALAAPVLLPMRALTLGTDRGAGFTTDVVLNQSVHPFTLLQIVVGNLYGDLRDLTDRWWGANFFNNGFPYFLSLYLGAPVLVLAVFGVARRPFGRRLALLLVVALVICLGQFFVLRPIVDALPPGLRLFRFPTKAFFTVHFAVALLAAFGLDRLLEAEAWRWRRAALSWSAPAVLLLAAPLLPWALPEATAWFLAHFFPPGIPAAGRPPLLFDILRDAATGGFVCAACAAIAGVTAAGRLAPRRAAVLVVLLVGGDLLRTGAALNPMVAPEVLRVSPEVAQLVSNLPGRQRVFTCDPRYSAAYWQARLARTDHEVFTFVTWMETLAPNYNMPPGIATALSEDLTSLVPSRATLPPGQSCRDVAALVPAWRHAAVTHILTLDPLVSADLQPIAQLRLRRVAPLVLHLYALRDPEAIASLAPLNPGHTPGLLAGLHFRSDSIKARVQAAAPQRLRVRSSSALGWQARVNGSPLPVGSYEGHVELELPAGASLVELRYSPPGLRRGLALFGSALVALAWLMATSRARDARVPAREE